MDAERKGSDERLSAKYYFINFFIGFNLRNGSA